MNTTKQLAGCVFALLSAYSYAGDAPFATVGVRATSIEVQPNVSIDAMAIRISGPNLSFQKPLTPAGESLSIDQLGVVDAGTYRYEITGVTFTGETERVNGNGRAPGAVLKKSVVENASGEFTFDGRVLTSPTTR
ncbi:hypothetical protein [Teredinibacter turnerae]|uniref:hypothetical protein n=1 Tax=Teredinibacter turnerae TaxID=2426 RepID=UPI00040F058C|nr:hypothetical protein [Teredinibacter turnerae]